MTNRNTTRVLVEWFFELNLRWGSGTVADIQRILVVKTRIAQLVNLCFGNWIWIELVYVLNWKDFLGLLLDKLVLMGNWTLTKFSP
ncbi:hypothetical protein IMY05_012G0036500 [Salix suchowensis]|nr:hypothetical protein IMY05_012G0036500 [Salix suchowensis]